jgi:hypothetical protein
MPKQFFTEIDIEDLAKHGVQTLEVNDSVVLTELAFEKAQKLGIRLVQGQPENPPAAPVRPYLSTAPAVPSTPAAPAKPAAPAPVHLTATLPAPSPAPAGGGLHDRILQAVHARLGDQIEAEMLENIIQRVLNSLGMK